jgi:hypothetical protein
MDLKRIKASEVSGSGSEDGLKRAKCVKASEAASGSGVDETLGMKR